ncbi:MAG: Gfo/Idh/MocA family oxidoreductase [Ruminococcaceae bacterium]|nr:Gfo/Idh/MocA family oxidoreductase [Oscillospiraceae bacterium]
MKKLNVAIIGTGGISNSHMDGYKQLTDRAEVVAVCDIDGAKAKRYAEKYNVPRVYTDYNEMMAKEKLDCVSVTTWNSAHKGATIAALRGGANVLCEKPMAMNAAEAEEMRAAAKEAGKILQIGFVRRFGADAARMCQLRDEGLLGDIYYSKVSYLRKDGCPGGWFGDKAYSGGGPLIDLGVHVIDMARYIAGSPKPVSAYGVTFDNLGCKRASGGQVAWAGPDKKTGYQYTVEDFASALIRFDNGFTISVETSFNLNIDGDRGNVEIFGTKAGVNVNNGEMYTTMAGKYVKVGTYGYRGFGFENEFQQEVKEFIDASQGLCPCRATAEDGVWLMKILDAIYESARTGKSVDITPIAD